MFCTKMRSQIKRMLRQFDNYVNEHINTALKITIALKRVLSSPVADIITTIIPGDVDNIIRQQLLMALEKATTVLLMADKCRRYTSISEKLDCLVRELRQQSPELQDAFLQKLASLLAGELDGNRLKQSLYDLYTQAKYSVTKQ
jgi:hypothetical protein